MDGQVTGTLYLMCDTRGATPKCMCQWRSQKTMLSTDWHGSWAHTATGIRCNFDCCGKPTMKYTDIIPEGVGTDHQGRMITVVEQNVFTLDEEAMAFAMDK